MNIYKTSNIWNVGERFDLTTQAWISGFIFAFAFPAYITVMVSYALDSVIVHRGVRWEIVRLIKYLPSYIGDKILKINAIHDKALKKLINQQRWFVC